MKFLIPFSSNARWRTNSRAILFSKMKGEKRKQKIEGWRCMDRQIDGCGSGKSGWWVTRRRWQGGGRRERGEGQRAGESDCVCPALSFGLWLPEGWKAGLLSSASSRCCCSTPSSSGWATQTEMHLLVAGYFIALSFAFQRFFAHRGINKGLLSCCFFILRKVVLFAFSLSIYILSWWEKSSNVMLDVWNFSFF